MKKRMRFNVLYGKPVTVEVDIGKEPPDGWWAYLPGDWLFLDNDCSAQHEDTKKEVMACLRGAKIYDEVEAKKRAEKMKERGCRECQYRSNRALSCARILSDTCPGPNGSGMTKQDAVKEMRRCARDIWNVDHAKKVAKPFGLPDEKLPVVNYQPEKFRAVITVPGDGVSVGDLAQVLVKHVGKEPNDDRPYSGAGRNAEHITIENCKILGEFLKEKVAC